MNFITIKQPWASAIVLGSKNVENRTWKPPESAIGMLLAIHAGKSWDDEGAEDCAEIWYRFGGKYPAPETQDDFPRGAIIGVTRLLRVVTDFDSPWFFGPYGWVFDNVMPITPVPCRGTQGFSRLPDYVLYAVRAEMERVYALEVTP